MLLIILFFRASNYLSGHPTHDIDLEERNLTRSQRQEEQSQRFMPVYQKLEELARKAEAEKHP